MNLKDILNEMHKLGYPVVAVFASGEDINAIVFAESDDALRITMAKPEEWEVWRQK